MITELEIVDTAVKVGLGALITAISTYFLALRNQAHEIKKAFLNEKKELLKQSAIKLEKSSSLFNLALEAISHLASSAPENVDKKLSEILMKNFTDAYNESKDARAFCYMIGDKALGELISQYLDSMEELIKHYEEHRLAFKSDFVNSNIDKRNEIKSAILSQLSRTFASIHGE